MNGLLAPKAAVAEADEEEEERPPSIAPSEKSQQSLGTDATHETAATNASSANGGEGPRQKWWKRLGGTRNQSPHRQPPPPSAPPVRSVNSTPTQADETAASPAASSHSLPVPTAPSTTLSPNPELDTLRALPESSSAPQIVVRGPTLSTHIDHFPSAALSVPDVEVPPPPETR